jgi:predicted Zn-dependent protease
MSTEKEVEIGRAAAKQVEKELKLVRDPVLLERLDRVGQRMAAVSDRTDLLYRFNIVEMKEGETEIPNAFALPGGPVYVTTGLLQMLKTDDELAAVLGHEIGHVVGRHAAKRFQGALGLQLLQVLAVGTKSTRTVGDRQNLDIALASLITQYSQGDELEADKLSVRYLKKAGYDPAAALKALEALQDFTFKQPARRYAYFRTHPFFADRLRLVRQEATGQIGFDDYINSRR